jgi:Planctomycete extracellular
VVSGAGAFGVVRGRIAVLGASRRRGRRLVVESLEVRQVLSATISGSVFQTLDASGPYPSPVAQSSTNPASVFLNLVGGVSVMLDGSTMVSTGTSGSSLGTFPLPNVASDSHAITIQPPASTARPSERASQPPR